MLESILQNDDAEQGQKVRHATMIAPLDALTHHLHSPLGQTLRRHGQPLRAIPLEHRLERLHHEQSRALQPKETRLQDEEGVVGRVGGEECWETEGDYSDGYHQAELPGTACQGECGMQ